MKKLLLIIGIMLVVLVPAGVSFAGHWGGHGYGHGGYWGGGIYIGPGIYPYAYPYPYYYPYPAYSYPYPAPAQCETRCYKRVVPTCGTNERGERTCRDEVVRTCKKYCY